MKLTDKELAKLAELSRLEISPEELPHYQKSINDIIEYVGVLQSVGVEAAVTHEEPLKFEDVLQSDEVNAAPLGDWKANLPKQRDGYIEVDAVFEKNNDTA